MEYPPHAARHQHAFRSEYRIRAGADFARAFNRKVRAGDGLVLVFGCENGLPHPRLGLVVSRKIGKAVFRNRWKRLLREAFRLTLPRLPAGIDLVVLPRAETQPQLKPLMQSLPRLAGRIAAQLKRRPPTLALGGPGAKTRPESGTADRAPPPRKQPPGDGGHAASD